MSVFSILDNATLRVYREERSEPYEPPTRYLVGRWRAHVSAPTASVEEAGGVESRRLYRTVATLPVEAAPVVDTRCTVEDAAGTRYEVEATSTSRGLGLDRCRLLLRRVEGLS
jgi:hypothetical protein